MDVVLASNNSGKIREFRQLLADVGFAVLPQSSLGIESVEETGLTFVENAIIKARHAACVALRPAIADDSGLEVDCLRGAPGIFSARFANQQASDKDNNSYLLERLTGVPEHERTARYQAVIVYLRHAEDPTPLICQASWEGVIATDCRGDGGFGYDPLFIVAGKNARASELNSVEKNQISHRGRALKQLIAGLKARDLPSHCGN